MVGPYRADPCGEGVGVEWWVLTAQTPVGRVGGRMVGPYRADPCGAGLFQPTIVGVRIQTGSVNVHTRPSLHPHKLTGETLVCSRTYRGDKQQRLQEQKEWCKAYRAYTSAYSLYGRIAWVWGAAVHTDFGLGAPFKFHERALETF